MNLKKQISFLFYVVNIHPLSALEEMWSVSYCWFKMLLCIGWLLFFSIVKWALFNKIFVGKCERHWIDTNLPSFKTQAWHYIIITNLLWISFLQTLLMFNTRGQIYWPRFFMFKSKMLIWGRQKWSREILLNQLHFSGTFIQNLLQANTHVSTVNLLCQELRS